MPDKNNEPIAQAEDLSEVEKATEKQPVSSVQSVRSCNREKTQKKSATRFQSMRRSFKRRGKRFLGPLMYGVVGFIVGIIATIWFCSVVFDLGRNYNPEGDSAEGYYDLTVLQERISRCNELATATYLYTDAEVFEDEKAVFGYFDIPLLTGKSFVLKYDGIIKVGVDLDETVIEQEDGGSVVSVIVPEPHIISHEIDEDSVKVLRQQETIFSSLRIEDIQSFRSQQKEAMEHRAEEAGIMEEADKNAQESLRAIIQMVVPDGVEIIFHHKSESTDEAEN